MPDLSFPLPTISWFIAIASLAALAWAVGIVVGRSPAPTSRAALLAAVVMLLGWGYLMRNQEVAVQLLPAWFLGRIEGVAAVPLFMLIVGIAWSKAQMSRQRHVIVWAMIVGAIYFVQGGWWMVQPTPALGAGRTYGDSYVYQSEDYTCVAAASATALRILGIDTSEAEMVALTDTRPGTGSTTIRAMAGLQRKLEGTGLRVDLISPTFHELQLVSVPALTPLQFDRTRRHMVTILKVSADGVVIADPTEGSLFLSRAEFEAAYRGQVLVIRER